MSYCFREQPTWHMVIRDKRFSATIIIWDFIFFRIQVSIIVAKLLSITFSSEVNNGGVKSIISTFAGLWSLPEIHGGISYHVQIQIMTYSVCDLL